MVKRKLSKSLLLFTLSVFTVTGCSSNSPSQEANKTPVQTPSPKQSGNSEQVEVPGFDYSAKIELATNDLELEFLTIAIDSCKKAQTDGFIISDSTGTSYFRPAKTGIFPLWPFDEFRATDSSDTSAEWNNYPPGFFSPCSLEHQARGRDTSAVGFEHKVTRISSSQYIWAQHQGGYNLEESTFDVKDGLIVKETFGESDFSYSVKYGPFSKSDLEGFKVTE